MKSVAFALVFLATCSDPAGREARSLVAMVDRYRLVGAEAKPGAAASVRALLCNDSQVCDAKRVCVGGIDALERSTSLRREVEIAVTEATRDRTELLKKLDEAEALLHEGGEKLEQCDKQLMALRTKHRL